jgi:hypothetical protein
MNLHYINNSVEHAANLNDIYNKNCQEAVGNWVMSPHHANRLYTIVVYAFFASYNPYVYVQS